VSRRVDQAEIEKAVRRIHERDGVCSPRAFVDAARPEESRLHNLFDWDDAAAAESWRQHQARAHIARVKILVEERPTPAFVHVTITDDDGVRREGYVPTAVALSDAALRSQVFGEARAGLAGWVSRLAAFEESASVARKLIEEAIEALPVAEEDPPEPD
jgi:hypothetical protein